MSEELEQKNRKLILIASQASVMVAIFLLALKGGAWALSGSVSLLASFTDSMMDALASVVNLFAVRVALSPADEDHPFGHTKAEAIAGTCQSAFIMGSAIFLALHSFDRVLNPQQINHTGIALVVMVVSTVMTLALVLFQRYVIKRTQSLIIKVDSLHYLSDLFVNIAIIGALIFTLQGGGLFIDAILGIVVAVVIFRGAYGLCIESLDILMDKSLPDSMLGEIQTLVLSHEGVKGIHKLRTHSTGRVKFIQFHIDLDENLTLKEAHAISQLVEDRIMETYEGADVVIHQDPVTINEP